MTAEQPEMVADPTSTVFAPPRGPALDVLGYKVLVRDRPDRLAPDPFWTDTWDDVIFPTYALGVAEVEAARRTGADVMLVALSPVPLPGGTE